MPEILSEYEFRPRGRASTHPYGEWLDGRIRRLKRGEDFAGTTKSTRKLLYDQGKKRDVKVHVSIEDPDTIVVQAETGARPTQEELSAMPPRVRGGHQQGLKTTIVVAVEPEMRRKIEEEADARKTGGWSDHTLSGVVRDALEDFFAAEGSED